MPKSKIDQTIKKLADGMTAESLKISSTEGNSAELPGDPNCPLCAGMGYLRRDLPIGHPNFGRVEICQCRRREVSSNARNRLFELSQLDELKELTFDTFNPNKRSGMGEEQALNLELAFNTAQQYAGNLRGWFLLQGGYGCGKTHLAAAIANQAVSMGVPTLFLTVPDLLDSLRFAYDSDDTTFERRFNEIRNAQLLVLDDFGTQNATGWAREKLFQILNYRYINQLSLVVTTNLSMNEIEERIRSRLKDSELVTSLIITAPDYRRPENDLGHSELSSLSLLSTKTFDTFQSRRVEKLHEGDYASLDSALKAARAFAENPRGWIAFTGNYGCSKTHLAAAIANYRSGLGEPPLFIMIPDLLDHLRATFNPQSGSSYDRRFDEIRSAPLLILDDLGAQSSTPWAREKLHQLINYRYNAELPTVITIATDMLVELEERLRVRLLDERLCAMHYISAPAFMGAKKKAKK